MVQWCVCTHSSGIQALPGGLQIAWGLRFPWKAAAANGAAVCNLALSMESPAQPKRINPPDLGRPSHLSFGPGKAQRRFLAQSWVKQSVSAPSQLLVWLSPDSYYKDTKTNCGPRPCTPWKHAFRKPELMTVVTSLPTPIGSSSTEASIDREMKPSEQNF